MRRLSHTAPETVGAAIDRCARALRRAGVHFGHGTDNARDEAAELVFFAAGLAHTAGPAAYGKPLTARRAARIDALLQKRITRRTPLAYLTRRAFFAGLELYVDERVLVPRSPIAELILKRFAPWATAAPRTPNTGYRHRLGRHRAGKRRRLSPRHRGRGRHLRRCARGLSPQRAPLGLGAAGQGSALGSFRRRGGLPLRYHREQPALRRARRNARPCRASTAMNPHWAWPRGSTVWTP